MIDCAKLKINWIKEPYKNTRAVNKIPKNDFIFEIEQLRNSSSKENKSFETNENYQY